MCASDIIQSVCMLCVCVPWAVLRCDLEMGVKRRGEGIEEGKFWGMEDGEGPLRGKGVCIQV